MVLSTTSTAISGRAKTRAFLLVVASMFWSQASSSNPQTPNLKKIILGRCLADPPSEDVDKQLCRSLVSDFMTILETKNDADIITDDYETFLSKADFSTEPDSALFWPGADGRKILDFLVRPEETPGGALLDGVVFCGSGTKEDCPFGDFYEQDDFWTGAQASFWSGVYSAFASEVSGKIRVVASDDAAMEPGTLGQESLFLTAALPKLDAGRIRGAEIYVAGGGDDGLMMCDTSSSVMELKAALEAHGIHPVYCMGDPSLLYETRREMKTHHVYLVNFVAILFAIAGFFTIKNMNLLRGYKKVPDVTTLEQ